MPQGEYSRIAGRRHESGNYFPFLNGFSSRVGGDLSELVWENGQVTVQGQSSKLSRPSLVTSLPSGVPSEPIEGQKIGILHDISPVVPPSELDLCLTNELAPWLDYPFDDGMEQGFGSQRLPEVTAVMEHGISDGNGCELGQSNLDSGEKGPPFSYDPLWPLQNRQAPGGSGSRAQDSISNQTEYLFENQDQNRDLFSDDRHRRSNSKMVNFPHFSKPNAANLQDPVGIPASGGPNCKNIDTSFHVSAAPEEVSNAMQELAKQVLNEDLPKETDNGNMKLQVQGSETLEKQISCDELPVEQNVACSSVGSGHGAEVVSSDQTNQCKRKSFDADDSGVHSDDDDIVYVAEKKHAPSVRGSVSRRSEVVEVDTDHADGKKPTPPRKGTSGSKRSRVAEVHNLSERRRRDRINEKMRALQELIPNCNKADKASMLGEAIEYLKMLQFQVQFMSMGGGLCMRPVMFPQGIQPMYHHHHLAPFPPMGVGMSPGFGMGMVDSRSPIFPATLPPVPHIPSPVSGPSSMFRVTGPGLPVYGHPCEGPPTQMNSQHAAVPATGYHNKQPCPPAALNPTNPNTKTSSRSASSAAVSRRSR